MLLAYVMEFQSGVPSRQRSEFEGSEVVDGVGDGGVDAKGVLEIANLASVRIYVQAKRYALGRKVKSSEIKKLRGMIPMDGQAALITTGEFKKDAHEIASCRVSGSVGVAAGVGAGSVA